MEILGIKEGHDGTYALLNNGRLQFSIEAEKDSYPRCIPTSNDLLLRAAQLIGSTPDVVAVGGWTKGLFSSDSPTFAGYFGSSQAHASVKEQEFFGRPLKLFTSTHEASHIWGAYGMSPFAQGEPCYVLVWEGNVGNFYLIDEQVTVRDLGIVLTDPGNRYTFAFSLADPRSHDEVGYYDTSHPGKMMALAAYGDNTEVDPAIEALLSRLLLVPQFHLMTRLSKGNFRDSPLFNCGVESQLFKNFARRISDKLFDIFFEFAEKNLRPGLPLLISGGCGLNCEWNHRWRQSGFFKDVFVPPICNDAGSAVGTALHAQYFLTGRAKLEWSAFAGEDFDEDVPVDESKFKSASLSSVEQAELLSSGAVLAWVEGKYEMGPRALGHRSLIAEPFKPSTLERLNRIKKREQYRPIAPICTERAMANFEPTLTSPHMLFFYRVLNTHLQAITHVDGSARAQTLFREETPRLHALLEAFGAKTGSEILCNTSLNFKGRGFINRMSDLQSFVWSEGIDGFVVNGNTWLRKPTT